MGCTQGLCSDADPGHDVMRMVMLLVEKGSGAL